MDERKISSVVDGNAAGQRLDIWLSKRFTYHSRNQWQDIVKKGMILVNGKKSRSSRTLQEGDSVSFIPDVSEPGVNLNFRIEYEDENIILVNKPGNLPCHPAGPFFENTLWRKLSETYEKISIVNRLDRETSGLVIAAKSSEGASKFSELFSEGKIEKKYIAIVFGEFPEKLEAEGFLIGDASSEVRKKRKFVYECESSGAETAFTHFRLLGKNRKFSVVEAAPKTGRLHQIRATLFSLGFPLAGDKLYGPDDTAYIRFAEGMLTEDDKVRLALPRQALHAYFLSFVHPFTGKDIKFEISIPEDILPLYMDCMGV